MNPESPQQISWYVVYDTSTGHIVHRHQFIDEPSGDVYQASDHVARADREAIVLDLAKEYFDDATTLQVMRVPPEVSLAEDVVYRVDPQSRALVEQSRAPRTPAEIRERLRAQRARRSAK